MTIGADGSTTTAGPGVYAGDAAVTESAVCAFAAGGFAGGAFGAGGVFAAGFAAGGGGAGRSSGADLLQAARASRATPRRGVMLGRNTGSPESAAAAALGRSRGALR